MKNAVDRPQDPENRERLRLDELAPIIGAARAKPTTRRFARTGGHCRIDQVSAALCDPRLCTVFTKARRFIAGHLRNPKPATRHNPKSAAVADAGLGNDVSPASSRRPLAMASSQSREMRPALPSMLRREVVPALPGALNPDLRPAGDIGLREARKSLAPTSAGHCDRGS